MKKRNGLGIAPTIAPTPLERRGRRMPLVNDRKTRVPDWLSARHCTRRVLVTVQVPHPRYGAAVPYFRSHLEHPDDCTHGRDE